MKKIAFGSVIYKQSLPYFKDFIESLINQSTKEFDILLLNDNINLEDNLEVKEYVKENDNIYIINPHKKMKPYELRIQLFIEAKKRNYDLLVLGDSDDFFDLKRIERVFEKFLNYPEFSFYYNKLLTFDEKSALGEIPSYVDSIQYILEQNFLGLSNTALNLKKFDITWFESLLDGDTFVFDWYLYSRILINKEKGIFVENTATYYRIYDRNYAGLFNNKREKIIKEYNVKIKHYGILSKWSKIYKDLYEKYSNLDINNYITRQHNLYWWSLIQLKERN